MRVVNWIVVNYDALIALATLLLFAVKAIAQLTGWGKSHEGALQKMAEVVEAVGDPELKQQIAEKFERASAAERAAVQQAVAVADPKKIPLTRKQIVFKEAMQAARILTMPRSK